MWMQRSAYSVLMLLALVSMAFGQGFELKIPRGPSWESFYKKKPECAHLIGQQPLSLFGIEANQLRSGMPGLTVTNVDPNGPTSGILQRGDLLVSINGKAIVRTRRGEANPVPGLMEGYNFSRGIYVYGFRDNQPVEHVLLPCGVDETIFPFNNTDLFGSLYEDKPRGANISREILIAGFSRGKAAGRSPSTGFKDNEYVLQDHYCWIKENSEFDVVSTTANVSATGGKYNERKTRYSYPVDHALMNNIQRNFEQTHNDARILTREVELAVSRLLSQIGCANPEWKGLEQKIYQLTGRDWDRARNQTVKWSSLGLRPPNH